MTEKQAYIAFSAFPPIGPARFELLLKYFGSAKNAWNAPFEEYGKLGMSDKSVGKLQEFRKKFSLERYLDKLEKLGVEVVTKKEKEYTERLREIPDAPYALYIKRQSKKQELGSFCNVAIAVVGTRKATVYGREVTERLVTGLADSGVTIISGLALGIDAVAHKTALDAGGKTIGVLGCGLDQVYPPSNLNLAKKMLESGQGILVSEYPLGYPAIPTNFPQRNRIVSGLSLGVLVIEGTDRSGTLLTAAAAASQGRDVFAVPGPITSPTSKAAHILLRQGAKLVEKAEDILEELKIESRILNIESRKIFPETEDEKKILAILINEPLDIDSLVRISDLEAGKLLGILTTMELKGIVKNIGGVYQKINQ